MDLFTPLTITNEQMKVSFRGENLSLVELLTAHIPPAMTGHKSTLLDFKGSPAEKKAGRHSFRSCGSNGDFDRARLTACVASWDEGGFTQ